MLPLTLGSGSGGGAMDFGIDGRRALVSGTNDSLSSACARALEAEGVRVVEKADDDVDIVVVHGPRHPGEGLLGIESSDQLDAAWDAVVAAVATYRQVIPAMSARKWGRLVWVGSAAAKSLNADDDELSAMLSLAMM